MRAAHAIAAAGLLIVCGAARPEPCRASQQAKTPAQEAKPDPAASKDDAPVWTADLSKAAIPQKPATGRLHGEPFTLERAELNQGVLSLRQGKEFFADLEFKLFLFTSNPAQLEGRSLEILDEDNPPVTSVPHIYMSWKPEPKALPKTKTWTGDYVIRLQFGKIENGRLAGQIYLCLPDMKQSFVAGTFHAILK